MRYDQNEKSQLQLTFTSHPCGHRIVHFDLHLLVPEDQRLRISDKDYSNVVVFSSKEFRSICHYFGLIGDTLTISCCADNITFEVNGEIGRGDVEYSHQPEDQLNHKNGVHVMQSSDDILSQMFAVRFLQSFSRASTFAKQVTLSMDEHAPLLCQFRLEHQGKLKFFLAPKVEPDDSS